MDTAAKPLAEREEFVCPTPQDEAAFQDSAPLGGGETGSLLEPGDRPGVFGAQGKKTLGFHEGCWNQSISPKL